MMAGEVISMYGTFGERSIRGMAMRGDDGKLGSGVSWCILRMSGGNTIPVANALTEAGFEVWSPVETQSRRVGRSRDRREVVVPITPGIVFANALQLHDLIALARSPALTYRKWNSESRRMEMHGCPSFSVFRYQGQYPRIADRSLDPLRQAERRAAPKQKVAALEDGQEVRCPEAGFDGLIGIVQQSKGRHALVLFPGLSIPVQIDAARLLPAKSAA